ncbi:MAG: hypothetical protein ACRD2F_09305, partial [Terriglobales bacterium]
MYSATVPVPLMVPPLAVQASAVLLLPVTAAVNATPAPGATVALAGLSVIAAPVWDLAPAAAVETWGAPPQPTLNQHKANAAPPAARENQRERCKWRPSEKRET